MSNGYTTPSSAQYTPTLALGAEGYRVVSVERTALASGAMREIVTLHKGSQSYRVMVRGEVGPRLQVGSIVALVGHANPLDGVVERACIVLGF